MYSNRTGSSFQPHSLAATAGVDQSVDTFVLARDHHPAAVAGKLPLDPIQTLLPKARAEDCLLVHEMPNIPSGNSRNLQGLWSKAVPMRASVSRSPAHPVGEFRLRIVPQSLEAVRFERRVGQTPAVLRPRGEEMKVVIAASRTKRLHVRSGDVAIRLTTANRAAFAQALERRIARCHRFQHHSYHLSCRSCTDDLALGDETVRGCGDYQVLEKGTDGQHHLAVCGIDLRQPSRGVRPDPDLATVDAHGPGLGVVTAGRERRVVEQCMQLRCNERRRCRAWRLLHVLAGDSHAQLLHLGTLQAPKISPLKDHLTIVADC